MLHLSTPKISLQGTLKYAQYCKGNDAFYAELIIHLTMQNVSSNGGPATALESAIDGGRNVGFEWAPQSFL